MHRSRLAWAAVAVLVAAPAALMAQSAEETAKPKRELPKGLGGGPDLVNAWDLTVKVEALAPELDASGGTAAEADALLKTLRAETVVESRFLLSGKISRQEILSSDFMLPAGTVVMHQAGNRYYAIVDTKQQTFIPMDAQTLLNALEGGAGIENSKYDARVEHTAEKRPIAGFECRKSIVTVTYVSAIPFENEQVFVQRKNDIEVWHTAKIPSSAAHDHLFFKFQRDKTGVVRKALETEIGFPMEVSLVVTQEGAKKGPQVQSGSFHWVVTGAKHLKDVEAAEFSIPPAGYRKLKKNPYFKNLGGS